MRRMHLGFMLLLIGACLFVMISVIIIAEITIPGEFMFMLALLMTIFGGSGISIINDEL